MNKLQAFYKSRKWESFRRGVIADRTNGEGYVICEHCGKPIVRAYDLIAHHKQELTEINVDDVNVSLNPDNIALIHFRCHNELHKRYGFNRRPIKKVYIVFGAPCSGKTSFVEENAGDNDIILEIDRLYQGITKSGVHELPQAVKSNVFKLRDVMLDMIATRYGAWENAYIIGGYPLLNERERLADRVSADRIIYIDTPKEVCLLRLESEPNGRDRDKWRGYIDDWFARCTRPIE